MLDLLGREGLLRRSQNVAGAGVPGASLRDRGVRQNAVAPVVRTIVDIFLVVVLAVLAARLFWLILAPLPLPKGDPVVAAPNAEAAPAVVKSPFGAADFTAAAPVEAAGNVAETSLNLVLTGVWAVEDKPSAAIKTPDGDQRRYVIGDEIIDSVTLEAVFHDQVTIRRAGVREALRFESREKGAQRASPSPQKPNVKQPAGLPLREGARPVPGRSANGGGLASIFRVAPGIDAAGERTIELYASRNRQAFEKLGFRDGDRIVSIDGAPLPSNPAALSSVLSNLQRKSLAMIVIERAGEEISVNVSLANIQDE